MTTSDLQTPTGDGFWYLLGVAEEIMLSSHAIGRLDEGLVRERITALRFDERDEFVAVMEGLLYSADVVATTLVETDRTLRVRRKDPIESARTGSAARTRVEELADEVEYKELDDFLHSDPPENEGDVEGIIRESMMLIAWHANAPGSAPNANALLDSCIRAYPRSTRQKLAEAARVLQATAALILVVLAAVLEIEESSEQ